MNEKDFIEEAEASVSVAKKNTDNINVPIVSLSSETLAKALSFLTPVVLAKDARPLSVKVEKDVLKVSYENYWNSVHVFSKCHRKNAISLDRDLVSHVDYKIAARVMSNVPSLDVDLCFYNNKLRVLGSFTDTTIPQFNDTFIEAKSIESVIDFSNDASIFFNLKDFMYYLAIVSKSASVSDSSHLNSVLFEFDGKRLFLVSTDRLRMTIVSLPATSKLPAKKVIPLNTVKLINTSTRFDDYADDELKISYNPETPVIGFKTSNYNIITNTYNQEPADFKQFLNNYSKATSKINISKGDLLGCLKLVISTADSGKTIRIKTLDEETVIIETLDFHNPTIGELGCYFDLDSNVNFTVNAQFLYEAIENLTSDVVELAIINNQYIHIKDGNLELHQIVPISLVKN